MKPLFAILAFIGLTVIVIAFFGCCTKPLYTSQPFEMKLGDPNANPPSYVELKPGVGEGQLQRALARIKGHNGVCEITFLRHAGEQPDPHYCDKVRGNLRTNRVIKSASAVNARDASAANDPNVMYRVASSDPTDISGVLDLLKQ
jgi:hypothetical protein